MKKKITDKSTSKEKGKYLDDNQLAALKGFAGTIDWKLLPLLYVVIKDCTDNIDARNKILLCGMEVWFSNKGIEIDKSVALSEELIKKYPSCATMPV